ncbi:MAG: hypothetical protein RR482_08280 [Clostridia bacterium]
MAYDQDMLEKIEYLRSKASVGYEEAARLLERFDGDLTRALVELERSGRMKSEEATYTQKNADGGSQQETFKHKASSFVSMLIGNRLMVRKGETVIANLSLLYCIVAVVIAPHLMILSVLLMFLCGYRVEKTRMEDSVQSTDVEDFMDKTARNIRRTVSSFTEPKPPQQQPKQSPRKEGDDEGGEITIE